MFLNSTFLLLPSFFKPQKLGRTNLLCHINGSPLPCYATNTNVSQRKSANYQPTIWNYDTLQSLKHDYTDLRYVDRGRRLQDEVRSMIKDENVEIFELIEIVKRLGLSYHFEEEIGEAIDRFLSLESSNNTSIRTSLHETALRFKLLREYGYDVSEDIFERFKDHNGNFKAFLVNDIKGMLSLYEASFLSYEGEQILDEANAFTTFHLTCLKEDKNSFLFEQVNHSLELPLHRRFQRLEARWYIESYQKRKEANMVLVEAAKLDFNIFQSNLQQELKEMSRWWQATGLAPKLSFGRDRLMECYFWAVGMSPFEHQFSDLRKGLTKLISLITLIDDIYDVYGTLDELQIFTTALESWDINNAIQILPEYMKIVFFALYNTVNELAYDALKEKGLDILPYLIKAWSDLLKSFLQEARWCDDKQLPKFDEYLNNAWVSSSGVVLLTHSYFLLNHSITKEGLEYLQNCHVLLKRPSMIFRLCNDLVTSSVELQRGEGTNSIMCYMNENGVSEEAAYKHIHSLLNETWKKMNKDRFTNSTFSKYFVEIAINLARISHCTYQHGDGHSAPDIIAKNRIKALILEPID